MKALRAMIHENAPMPSVRTSEELDDLLANAASEAKSVGLLNVVMLYAPNDDHLFLVVGGEETVVGFNYGHGNPPYYASRGQVETDAPVLTAYLSLEHHTEFPRRWVIPMELGHRASQEFLATTERPTVISWEEL